MTQRGVTVLRKLTELRPEAGLTVITTAGESWEPAFIEDLRRLTLARDGRYLEARNLADLSRERAWDGSDLDLLLLVNWRYLVPAVVYTAPRRGTFVFHDSLLPRYRGFSPTSWAIINGEDHTGATLFAIADEVDAGDIIGQRRVPIADEDTVGCVLARVTDAYVKLLEDHLDALLSGSAPRHPQDHRVATYGCKRVPKDNRIDWGAPTTAIHNLIRAVTTPYPGAFTTAAGKPLRIWSARPDGASRRYVGRVPGAVVEIREGQGVVVLTGDGSILIEQVQAPGRPSLNATEVLSSLSLRLGP